MGMSAHDNLGIKTWSPKDFMMIFVMWAIMMIGMMVPTAMRSVMIFSNIGAKASKQNKPFASAIWFAAGYILIWTLFSMGATVAQWGLTRAALLSPMMISSSIFLGAFLLIVAGLWQFSALKDTCLRHCQSPAMYISQHFRPGVIGAVNLGIRHGLYCLGCCWVLMGLLFIGGVMNLIWVLAITLFILFEKLAPPRLQSSRISGFSMIAVGIILLIIAFAP